MEEKLELKKDAGLLAGVISSVSKLIVEKNLGSSWDVFNALLACKSINLDAVKAAMADGVSEEEEQALLDGFNGSLRLPDDKFDGQVKETLELVKLSVDIVEKGYSEGLGLFQSVSELVDKLKQVWA